jgi:hypothetical protein
LVTGSIDALSIPGAVAVDQSYFKRLGIKGMGASAKIRDQKVQVMAVTKGIHSFTTTPYVFTALDWARAYTGISPNKATYFLPGWRSAPISSVVAHPMAWRCWHIVNGSCHFPDNLRDDPKTS